LLVAAALVVCSAAQGIVFSSSASAAKQAAFLRPPGTRLDAGFRVARGTRLVGAVFPKLDPLLLDSTGWKAVLVVKSDAVSAMNAYAAQAEQLGYQQHSDPTPHCSSPAEDEVFCAGFYGRGKVLLQIAVHVCRSCGPPGGVTWPVSEAQLDYTMQSAPTSDPEREPITPLVGVPSGGPAPTVQLTSGEYRQMLEHPGRGAALQGFDLRGDVLIAPATSFNNCQSDLVGVVTGTNLVQLVRGAPTDINGSKVATVKNGITTWTLVRRSDLPQPVLLSDSCSD
jgi:hypothetical protein